MILPKHTNIILFDIESNGLLLDITKMWVGVTYNQTTKELKKFYSAEELTKYLIEDPLNLLVGHNILGFDIPALEKLTGLNINNTYIDTLTLAKLIYYNKDKSWSHSLDAYGERLGCKKGNHTDWTKFSPEMEEYCIQDVRVTKRLFDHLLKVSEWLSYEALDVEQKVQKIMSKQYINGWTFDTKEAQKLHIELLGELEDAEKELFKIFHPMYLPIGKTKTPAKAFKRNGIETVGQHQPVFLTEFNPSSGNHIVWWVNNLYGEQEWALTDKGNPKTDADTLLDMFENFEWAKPLLHYMEVKKLLGQLAEGPKAWLKVVSKDNKIHHSVDILGTNTGRATHSSPNVAQVPSITAYKGKEARTLFTHTKGKVNVGCDLSGVELRCLAHYMARYDKGAYKDVILEGDIHTENQKAAGLPTRDNAKTFIYAFLYGAGDAKIGSIVGGSKKEGGRLKKQFLKGLPALGELIKAVKLASKKGYLVGISGRRLHVRSEHSALNVLLQSLGAYISKYWMIIAHDKFLEYNLEVNQLGYIHDELQVECNEADKELIGKILIDSAREAGELLKLRCRIDAEYKAGNNWKEVH